MGEGNIDIDVEVENNNVEDDFDDFNVIVVASYSSFVMADFPLLLLFFIRGDLEDDGKGIVAAVVSMVVSVNTVNTIDTVRQH